MRDLSQTILPFLGNLSLTNQDLTPVIAAMESRLGNRVERLPIGGSSEDECKLVVLKPRSSSDGLAIACIGELADSNVVRMFDVALGMRVKGCLEPAIVRARRDTFDVMQKGKVRTA